MTDQPELPFNAPRSRKPKKATELPPKPPPPPIRWPRRCWLIFLAWCFWPSAGFLGRASNRIIEDFGIYLIGSAVAVSLGVGHFKYDWFRIPPAMETSKQEPVEKPKQESAKERDPWEAHTERAPS